MVGAEGGALVRPESEGGGRRRGGHGGCGGCGGCGKGKRKGGEQKCRTGGGDSGGDSGSGGGSGGGAAALAQLA
eukprot:9895796-Ditylum_brightwellii.AAC.1